MNDERIDAQFCEALAARLDECWTRLDDVVSELVALHGVPDETIVERVRETGALERAATTRPKSS